jgi:hypothetical protein
MALIARSTLQWSLKESPPAACLTRPHPSPSVAKYAPGLVLTPSLISARRPSSLSRGGAKAGLAGSFGGDIGEKSGRNLAEKYAVVPGVGTYEEDSWDSKNQWSGGVGGSVGAEIGCAGMAGYTWAW